MREFADFPDSLGSPLHSVETFGILFSSVSFRPACSFTVFRRSQNKARPQMRKIFYVLVPLIALTSLRQVEAVTINATMIANDTQMDVFVDSSGQEVYFRQGNYTGGPAGQNVVITNNNSSENDGQTYSGGQEFGISDPPAPYGSFDDPVADIWKNLQLGSDLSTFVGPNDDIEEAMLNISSDDRQTILRVDFEDTVSNVSVGFVVFPGAFGDLYDDEDDDPLVVDDNGNNSTFGFYAFDAAGVLLGRVTSTNDASLNQFPVLTSTFVGIKTLLIGSTPNSIVPIGIQSLSYDAEDDELPVVPEPASAALALFGLAGAYFGRRRLMAAA